MKRKETCSTFYYSKWTTNIRFADMWMGKGAIIPGPDEEQTVFFHALQMWWYKKLHFRDVSPQVLFTLPDRQNFRTDRQFRYPLKSHWSKRQEIWSVCKCWRSNHDWTQVQSARAQQNRAHYKSTGFMAWAVLLQDVKTFPNNFLDQFDTLPFH